MDKQLIKEAIKEIIEDGELYVKVHLSMSRENPDGFGDSWSAISDIDLEVELEVK